MTERCAAAASAAPSRVVAPMSDDPRGDSTFDTNRLSLVNGWIAWRVDHCTCAAEGLVGYQHEPHCGYEPLKKLDAGVLIPQMTVEVVAGVLATHRQPADPWAACSCGWVPTAAGSYRTHIAEEIVGASSHSTQASADAWDEGFAAGRSAGVASYTSSEYEPKTNPYRQHAQAPTGGDARGWVDRCRPVAADRRAPAAQKQVPVSPPTDGENLGAEPRLGAEAPHEGGSAQ